MPLSLRKKRDRSITWSRYEQAHKDKMWAALSDTYNPYPDAYDPLSQIEDFIFPNPTHQYICGSFAQVLP